MSSQRTVKRRRPNPPPSTPVPHPISRNTKKKMDWSIPLPRYDTQSLPFESLSEIDTVRLGLQTACLPVQPSPSGLQTSCSVLQSPCTADSSCSDSQCCEPISTSNQCSQTQGICCDSAAVPCMDEHCQKLIEEYCSQCLDHDPCLVENCTFDHCDECCDNTCTEQCSTEVHIPHPVSIP